MNRFENCHVCNGAIQSEVGPGRKRKYRGVEVELPTNFAIDVCTKCGRRWLSAQQIRELSPILENRDLISLLYDSLAGVRIR